MNVLFALLGSACIGAMAAIVAHDPLVGGLAGNGVMFITAAVCCTLEGRR